MGVTNVTYRLKAKVGDTAPNDELGVSGALSGGTIALVDRGSGDVAWQFSSGVASVVAPGRTISPTVAGGGVTVAITVRITNYGTLDYNVFAGFGTAAISPSEATTHPPGLCIGRVTANTIRATQNDASYTSSLTTDTTTDRTFVLRYGVNKSSNFERTDMWVGTTGRVGTAADRAGQAVTGTSVTLNTVSINASNGTVLQIKDFVVWGEELSDADAAAVADNLRGVLDATTPITGTVSWSEAASAFSIAGSSGSGAVSGSVGWSEVASTFAIAGGAGARIVTREFRNNAGTLRASVAGKLNVYNATTGALVVQISGSTTAAGKFDVSHAALVLGASYAYEADFTTAGYGRRLPTVTAA